jgi:hypothetical protein
LEQTTGNDESKWFSQRYLDHLKKAIEVWDYSLVNYQNLKKLGIERIRYVPFQYMTPTVAVGQPTDHTDRKDIDILFYGSLNQRRQTVLDQLSAKGYNLVVKSNLWGAERDQLIERSKIVINIHYYTTSLLETTRLSYLLSHQTIVVSEESCDRLLDRWHSKYLQLVPYQQLVESCQKILDNYTSYCQQIQPQLLEYIGLPYWQQIPIVMLKQHQYLLEGDIPKDINQKIQSPLVDSHDLFEAEQEVGSDHSLVLKLPKLDPSDLPPVTVVTVTHNRKSVFPMAVRNWELFEYPRDKLEWVIVDDSDDGTSLSSLLPRLTNIKYYRLQTTGRLSIGQKRNYGVDKATHQYIAFMDDDDYYYPFSVYARIALLLKYPKYDLVGVTDLDIYDVVNHFSARVKGSLISEASMAFRKSFWQQQKFPEQFSTLGEGYPFTKERRDRIIKMPSGFNIIAITHWSNYTQSGRSYDKFKGVKRMDDILSILDTPTKSFIIQLFGKIRKTSQVTVQ